MSVPLSISLAAALVQPAEPGSDAADGGDPVGLEASAGADGSTSLAPEEPEEPDPFEEEAEEETPAEQPAEESAETEGPASDASDASDDASPVTRAAAGNWGMTFIFGGLAPLSVAGVNNFSLNRLLFSEIGFRRVFDKIAIPFSVGLGVFHHRPDGGTAETDLGVSFSVGVMRWFRVWRRIAPFFGGTLHAHYTSPATAVPPNLDGYLVGIAAGPTFGIEYYIGHRVSLTLQAQFLAGVNLREQFTQIVAASSIAAGGQTGLTFYF